MIRGVADLDGVLHSGLEIRDVMTIIRDIDSIPLLQITLGILPMIGELQGRADGVTSFKSLGVMILICKPQHQTANRVGTASAVVDELIPCRISRDALILLKGINQIEKGIGLQLVVIDLRGECGKDGMNPFAMIEAGQRFFTPPVEKLKTSRRISNLITQVICPAAEGVDDRSPISHLLGNHPGKDREILVMTKGQPPAIGHGLG